MAGLEDPRMGTTRASMKTNVLLAKSELGKPKPSTFADPTDDRVFGAPNIRDPEGARDVTMVWKEHAANPNDKPGPDFRKMNKNAASMGLTSASEQHAHRSMNYETMKTGNAVKPKAPKVPSDVNVEHTYGIPSTHIPLEVYRVCGDPANVRNLIQNSYANDWINNNMEKEAAMRGSPTKKGGIGLTRAAEGHAFGAHTKYIVPADADEPFKMSKFKGVPSKVSTRR
mmetsp:Transcript_39789/g.103011  ORF Transcript_39789/g.103011 Transcript_39789/m.103011 type:complete len:227 (-) Transcript_39789:115-795(-)|eukprot:jgi/Tetstr1/426605/TSEL_016882.t1